MSRRNVNTHGRLFDLTLSTADLARVLLPGDEDAPARVVKQLGKTLRMIRMPGVDPHWMTLVRVQGGWEKLGSEWRFENDEQAADVLSAIGAEPLALAIEAEARRWKG